MVQTDHRKTWIGREGGRVQPTAYTLDTSKLSKSCASDPRWPPDTFSAVVTRYSMVWPKPHHHARGNERKREGQPMPRVDFDQLPDEARLWIFTAERSLSDAEQAQLLTEVDRFIGQWGAHDVPLTGGGSCDTTGSCSWPSTSGRPGRLAVRSTRWSVRRKPWSRRLASSWSTTHRSCSGRDRPSRGCHATSSPSSPPRGRWVSRRRSLTTR